MNINPERYEFWDDFGNMVLDSYSELPEILQERVERYLENTSLTSEEWWICFGPNEIACLQTAAAIDKFIRGEDDPHPDKYSELLLFMALPRELQETAVSNVAMIHVSPLTKNYVFIIAAIMICDNDPKSREFLLKFAHGVDCGAVGCEIYGCPKVTPEDPNYYMIEKMENDWKNGEDA